MLSLYSTSLSLHFPTKIINNLITTKAILPPLFNLSNQHKHQTSPIPSIFRLCFFHQHSSLTTHSANPPANCILPLPHLTTNSLCIPNLHPSIHSATSFNFCTTSIVNIQQSTFLIHLQQPSFQFLNRRTTADTPPS
ncbi:unnamed protein product [Vicia faba]|uniref:Uncharacterized protein n=1 Tax=Vicia faba TaxID=3906 RepID=A0AAV1B0P4_VICFA|nr:unnamed protein product [Vicia faba]